MLNFSPRGEIQPELPSSRVPLILGVETSLFVISFILWSMRMYTRSRPVRRLWWDDLFISLAMVLSIASYIVSILTVAAGYGLHTIYVPPAQLVQFARLCIVSEPLWVWEVTFIKVSIALMFLRLSQGMHWQKTWNFVMYFSIFYLFASAIIVLVLQMTECTPLRFFWDPTVEGGHCRSPEEVQTDIIATSVVFAFSDFQFSLLPIAFLLRLNRPLRERIIVACIMCLGITASAIGCIKFIDFDKVRDNQDPTWFTVPGKLGSFAEASIGIIAANIPPLKHVGGRLLNTTSSIFSNSVLSRDSNEKTVSLGNDITTRSYSHTMTMDTSGDKGCVTSEERV